MDQFTRAILRGAALPTAVVGIVIALVAGVTIDSKAAIGALLATVVVVVFFMLGQLVLGHVLKTNPTMGLSVALLLYIVKIGILLGLLLVLQGSTMFNTKAFAFTILACTLVWTSAEVWVFSRTKVLVVEPDNVPPAVQELHEMHKLDD
jgi:ATP synthase protein I